MDKTGPIERKPGRPKMPSWRKRHIMFEVRLSDSEYAQIKANADAAGLHMSEFMRQRALDPVSEHGAT